MNRRSFLRGLIAAPAIVAASSIMPVRAIERFAAGGIIPPGKLAIFGESFAGFRVGDMITFPVDYGGHLFGERMCRITAVNSCDTDGEFVITRGVRLSFVDSDWPTSHLRDTAEPQAPVSPDNQNEIPTAQADDLCHFGQESETLSPNVSRRLLRAWRAGA